MKELFDPWQFIERGRVGNDPPESYEVVDSRGATVADVFCLGHAKLIAASPVLVGIAREIKERVGVDVGDDSWNPDAHIELTLTVRECRAILEAVGMWKVS